MTDRKLRVFLCHSSQDKPIVRELYQRLSAEGWIDPWLDEEKLLPGQDWDMEIEKAVEAADVVIACLSNNSVTKEGYVQKELRKVLDVADEKPEGTIFIIPLRLNDCETPRRLKMWQRVDYFVEGSYEKLIRSLQTKSNNLDMSQSDSSRDFLPPLAQELFTYVIGDHVNDEAYVVKSPDGKVLGKYGIRVSKRIHQPIKGPVTAFDIWLYDAITDKGIIGTLIPKRKYTESILFNTRQTIEDGLIGAELEKPATFETENLRMICIISELQCDEGIESSENRFVLLVLKLKVWSK